MNFPVSEMPIAWLWIANGGIILIMLWVIRNTPWSHLKNPQDAHVFFAATLILWLMWRMSVGVLAGFEFHLLLVTTLTLMFGRAMASWGVLIAQSLLTLEGKADGLSFGLNMLCNGILPIWLTWLSYRLIDRYLPRHFFVYIFMGAFFTGALTMLANRLTGMSILWIAEVYKNIPNDYIALLPIMMFPEAFSNGGLITILVVYRPQWVSSFNDELYLRGK
ncbi:MAG: hypothetical protein RIT27_789 [Pseudomonadota bacterium]|jgi:uncharacterized membrane protein